MLKELILYNFRNYKRAHFTFSEGVNYIYGNNGQGKTSLLEALCCLITGRSFRTSYHDELVHEGAAGYFVEAHFSTNGIPQTLSLSYEGSKKKVIHNSTSLPSLSALFGILRGVFLLPEDDLLIKGSPSHRRLFCDLNLAQLKPLYIYHLSRYTRALKQRNSLLKQKSTEHLPLFERQMALSASYVTMMRRSLIEELGTLIQGLHLTLSNQSELLELHYVSQIREPLSQKELEEKFIERLAEERKKALLWGHSLLGPHRDDLQITLSKKEAKSFASEGQKRLAATTLKLAQWHYLNKHSEEKPLLSIDDIGLALDPLRTGLLYEYINDFGQLLLTSCTKPPAHLKEAHYIQVTSSSTL